MKLVDCLKNAKNVLIVGHIRPDGDCFGSGLAIKRICEKFGACVDFSIDSPMPEHYSFMEGVENVNATAHTNYDLVVAVDCADELRLGKYYSVFSKAPQSINIDHHVTNTRYGKINFVKDVSSTCELVYSLVKDDDVIDDYVAKCLYVGLSTDTGHFKHNNTTSATYVIASELVKYNVDTHYLLQKLYQSNTKRKMKLVAKAMSAIRYFKDDRIAIIPISMDMLKECECVMADTEGVIDYAMSIDCVEVAVCMTQQAKHSYKVSFRSKSVNVAEAAGVFGGGGHVLAAGCVVNGYYEDCVDKIVKSITDGMVD